MTAGKGASADETHSAVSQYYGQTLKSTADLKTTACCAAAIPSGLKKLLRDIHPEVLARFYGCGSPLPPLIKGCTVLDLGCGAGRDCYLASKLVGEEGSVIGVDMTDEQLAVANQHVEWHTERYGYSKPNVRFLKGVLEDLASVEIEDGTVDVVISNCVINLSAEKDKVLREACRVLKEGGELYFSDVFCDRRLDASLMKDKEILGECLAGAMYVEDFRRLLLELGCKDYRVIDSAPIEITDDRIKDKVGLAEFASVTVRCFKLREFEDRQEDFGQVAYYNGSAERPCNFELDRECRFEVGKPVLVSGNTALILTQTRLAPYFRVVGDRSVHYGLFKPAPSSGGASAATGGDNGKKAVKAGCC